LGYETQEILVGTQTSINVSLAESINNLEEIVVTAQGIKKSKRALGYGITTVDKKEIEKRPEANIARTLQGKIAGVNVIAASGETDGPATITIRSTLSINQSNFPLIIVDNVPFEGSIRNIDPNNIADLQVLKGLNASQLYGSQGKNGVILIQTKSGNAEFGEAKTKVTFSNSVYFNQIANLPDYQNSFGQGNDYVFVGTNFGNWGPAFSDLDEVPHPYSQYGDIFPEYQGATVPYSAKPDNIENLFNTGIGIINSINISSVQEKTSLNLFAGYTKESGIIGNNDVKRFNIGLGGKAQITDKFDIAATINYSTRKANRLQNDDIFTILLYLPRNIDITDYPYQDPTTGESIFYRESENPLWVLNNTGLYDDVSRVFGNIKLNYNFTDNLNLRYRIGVDSSQEDEFDYSNRGGRDENEIGFLNLDYNKAIAYDQNLILGLNRVKIGDKINLDAQIGINSRLLSGKSIFTASDDQIIYGYLRPENYRVTSSSYTSYSENELGTYGQLEFSYDNFLYATLSGRNDISSTIEKENNSLFYPGASVSFIPTSAFNFDSEIVNYLKIRGAYGTSAGFPGRYNTRNTLDTDPRRFVTNSGEVLITNSANSQFANPDLRPELHREFEMGIEGKFFNNRVTLETSAFKRISEDQILFKNLSPELGYSSTFINAGRIDTKGIEVDLGIDLIKTENFNWNFRNLFTAYETEVIDLAGETEIDLGNNRFAIEGQPLGVIKGSYALTDDEGNYLINPNDGELIRSGVIGLDDKVIADPNPDWNLTMLNIFQYKNFTFSTQFEYQHGGRIIGGAVEDLLERGVTQDTEDRLGSYIIPGFLGDPLTGDVLLDGDGNKIPNTIQLDAINVVSGNFYNATENRTFDTTTFRLREISLGYNLNTSKLKNIPFESLSFTVTGINLWYHAPYFPEHTNWDPENDGGNGDKTSPTTKRIALNVTFNF
jgi:TonB-linked SusC/RagA family outer membrane protein